MGSIVDKLVCPHCDHENERVAGEPEPGDETGIATWQGDCDGCGYPFAEIDHAERVVRGVLASAGVDQIRSDLHRKAIGVVLASMEAPESPADYQPRGRL